MLVWYLLCTRSHATREVMHTVKRGSPEASEATVSTYTDIQVVCIASCYIYRVFSKTQCELYPHPGRIEHCAPVPAVSPGRSCGM